MAESCFVRALSAASLLLSLLLVVLAPPTSTTYAFTTTTLARPVVDRWMSSTSSTSSSSTSSTRNKSSRYQQSIVLTTRTTTTTTTNTATASSLNAATPTEDTSSGSITLAYSPTSLLHLQSIESEADYSRPWTMEKTKAMVGAIALGTITGFGGEVLLSTALDMEKTFPFFGAVGAAAGWYLMGGPAISKSEQPKNGGFDGKLVADRPARLRTTLDYLKEHTSFIVKEVSTTRSEKELLTYIEAVHDKEYVANFRASSRASDQPHRLNPRYATTLIDEYSYDAALASVDVWLNSVDAALASSPNPQFALTRPPSHHACRAKAMGGCLLNSVAIAAHYALKKYPDAVRTVAILDIDAHHGNGIAHCIQDNPHIRFASLHEAKSKFYAPQPNSDDDPRTDAADDQGPLGNILNINLAPKTTWDSDYERLLTEQALPFLGNDADLLLVAAGMDAMSVDWSSSLQLTVTDYTKLGQMLKDRYGSKVALGLEGGYAYQEQELAKAIEALAQPWI